MTVLARGNILAKKIFEKFNFAKTLQKKILKKLFLKIKCNSLSQGKVLEKKRF